jgi:hypothetical protein
MIIKENSSSQTSNAALIARTGERGAALAAALLMLALLSAIALTVLAVVTTETRIAGSDLKRTQTFYCAAAGIEKMTSDYSALFRESARPTDVQIASVKDSPPAELDTIEGFNFEQSIAVDQATLDTMKTTQNIPLTDPKKLPTATLGTNSPYVGLLASVKPYILNTRCIAPDTSSVTLTRTMNNYLIPLFQFGMFSDTDIELHPGSLFTFNGRVHANGNIYLAGLVTLLDKVTSAHEVIYDYQRNGKKYTGATSTVKMNVGTPAVTATLNRGSIQFGPHIASSCVDPDGAGQLLAPMVNCFPDSATGTPWVLSTFDWATESPIKPTTTNYTNRFGGQLLTRVTGAAPLKLPMELDGNPTREIIKRRLATDNAPAPAETSPLSDSRYHTKAGIRILIDDEGVTNDQAGLYAAQNIDEFNTPVTGVNLSTFNPIPLPNSAAPAGGRALWRVNAAGTGYVNTALNSVAQENGGANTQAVTVRSARAAMQSVTLNGAATVIPAGAGLSGRILIQIVDSGGVWRDVTTQILSMGMTEGEPNAIVQLQRPLWAAFTQGSRDASGGTNQNLTDIVNNTYLAADGEIQTSTAPAQNAPYGYLTGITDDTAIADLLGARPIRRDATPALNVSDWGSGAWNTNRRWNAIVPINIYDVREGRLSTTSGTSTAQANAVYGRGIHSVVELNMENLARWMDGIYDANLLAGTTAVSTNIQRPDGFIVYVSDRRGDNVKAMTVPQFGTAPVTSSTFLATNGMADNVDIYGVAAGKMDAGEDVQETGIAVGTTLVVSSTTNGAFKDTAELPDPVAMDPTTNPNNLSKRTERALTVAAWPNTGNFRRAVRLFNAEDLQTTGAVDKLSTTLGITIASENIVYTWGNYNTQGINVNTAGCNVNGGPCAGTSSLNDATAPSHYMPDGTDRQVPASIVADAWSPLSKTWFDASSAINPDDSDGNYPFVDGRIADLLLSGTLPSTAETSVRAGIIAGNTLSALEGSPDAGNSSNNESKLNGGIHNLPRLLENWDNSRFNFVGALIPLYRSTQAVGPYNNNSTIYSAPVRNWAFDITFTDPLKLPPGTPMFQHVEPTGFKQVI